MRQLLTLYRPQIKIDLKSKITDQKRHENSTPGGTKDYGISGPAGLTSVGSDLDTTATEPKVLCCTGLTHCVYSGPQYNDQYPFNKYRQLEDHRVIPDTTKNRGLPNLGRGTVICYGCNREGHKICPCQNCRILRTTAANSHDSSSNIKIVRTSS